MKETLRELFRYYTSKKKKKIVWRRFHLFCSYCCCCCCCGGSRSFLCVVLTSHLSSPRALFLPSLAGGAVVVIGQKIKEGKKRKERGRESFVFLRSLSPSALFLVLCSFVLSLSHPRFLPHQISPSIFWGVREMVLEANFHNFADSQKRWNTAIPPKTNFKEKEKKCLLNFSESCCSLFMGMSSFPFFLAFLWWKPS